MSIPTAPGGTTSPHRPPRAANGPQDSPQVAVGPQERPPVDLITVFLRFPEPGKVKTRLAQRIGPDAAAELYRGWIGCVLGTLQPLRKRLRVVGYIDGAPACAFSCWAALVDDWWLQPAGDLGVRLSHAFRLGHQAGRKVLAIGTDCLELDADLLEGALDRLERDDVVLGPSLDGGYYLVGTAKPRERLFDDVRWSAPCTLEDQVRTCRRNGWSVGYLPARRDIDTWEDWEEHCRTRRA